MPDKSKVVGSVIWSCAQSEAAEANMITATSNIFMDLELDGFIDLFKFILCVLIVKRSASFASRLDLPLPKFEKARLAHPSVYSCRNTF